MLVSAKVPKKKLHSPFCSETIHVCRLYITPSNINLPLQHTFLISVSHPERTATDQPTSTQTTSAVRTPRSYTPAGGFLLHHSPHVQDVEGAAVSGSAASTCSIKLYDSLTHCRRRSRRRWQRRRRRKRKHPEAGRRSTCSGGRRWHNGRDTHA